MRIFLLKLRRKTSGTNVFADRRWLYVELCPLTPMEQIEFDAMLMVHHSISPDVRPLLSDYEIDFTQVEFNPLGGYSFQIP